MPKLHYLYLWQILHLLLRRFFFPMVQRDALMTLRWLPEKKTQRRVLGQSMYNGESGCEHATIADKELLHWLKKDHRFQRTPRRATSPGRRAFER